MMKRTRRCTRNDAKLAEKEENVIFGGRLGEYKYYDMDKVIASAMVRGKRNLWGIKFIIKYMQDQKVMAAAKWKITILQQLFS